MVSVDIAVDLAALTLNHGLEGLSPLFEQVIGSPPSAFTANYISSSDDKRSMKAGKSAQTRDRESPCLVLNLLLGIHSSDSTQLTSLVLLAPDTR